MVATYTDVLENDQAQLLRFEVTPTIGGTFDVELTYGAIETDAAHRGLTVAQLGGHLDYARTYQPHLKDRACDLRDPRSTIVRLTAENVLEGAALQEKLGR